MGKNIQNKLAFSIKKYNSETRKKDFFEDFKTIKSQKIIFEKNNFLGDFEEENDRKINEGLRKFQEVYNRKNSAISNENIIFTFSILDEKFFDEIDLKIFYNKLYTFIDTYFDIESFVVTKDSIGDITFYFACTTIVKKVFLSHVLDRLQSNNKTPEQVVGVLSYNLLLGGTKAENPILKFTTFLCEFLNEDSNYNLVPASDTEKMQYIIKSYDRASIKILEIELENKILLNQMIKDNPKFGPYIRSISDKHKLKYWNELFNK